ncbi:MAG TPA: Hsp20/alpha crystallin family protein [Nitrospirota bacterium]|nr:Hsp20/alpha crystallin family protein [Nitrospirota bacterium]
MGETVKEIQKKEAATPEGVERTRPRKVYTPAVDILERKDDIVVTADMPGVDEKSVDITLEKNVLTIYGMVEPQFPEGQRLALSEYGVGDYQRAFTLSEEVDRDRINASVKNGVLRLVLPKAAAVKARKIEVQAEA